MKMLSRCNINIHKRENGKEGEKTCVEFYFNVCQLKERKLTYESILFCTIVVWDNIVFLLGSIYGII